jgi:hypothetical protein
LDKFVTASEKSEEATNKEVTSDNSSITDSKTTDTVEKIPEEELEKFKKQWNNLY